MRTFALDVHKNFSEVAVHEGGQVRRVGRVETRDLRAFAAALEPTDHVVLESTSVSWAIVDLLAEHAGKITMSNPMQTKAIAQAKVKTDKVDAKVLAKLGAADFVAEVWVPDTETRALRRRVAHRASLVRQRSALRNQVHAILARNLLALEATDLFGKKGRALLGAVELPEHESEQLASALRLHDALQGEVQRLERTLAGHALKRQSVRRLMTIPGVGSITALSILSVIGEVSRFPSARHLVGYLGLDPKVRSRASGRLARVTSRARAKPMRAGCSSRRPMPRCARPGPCGPSTGASGPAAVRRSRSWPPPASSPRCAGTCSPERRTAASRLRRSP